jgi:branched-chain amino acid transport system permease protein
MDASLIIQNAINGIFLGTMYGIAAIGLGLIFGTMRIVFIAQGSVLVFFAYLCFWGFNLLGIDPYVSLVPIIILAMLFGSGIYWLLFKEASALQDRIGSLLMAVGLMFVMNNLMTVIWTANPRAVVTSYGFAQLHLGELNFTLTRIFGLLLAVGATIGVYFFLRKTLIGTAVRAASEDVEASKIMGINPNLVNAVAFAVGIGMAAVAGVNVATTYSFDPNYGFDVAIKALIALTLGGIGSSFGALAGGIILGLIEVFGTYTVGAGWSQAVVFVFFILVLIVKPEGLFGRSSTKV